MSKSVKTLCGHCNEMRCGCLACGMCGSLVCRTCQWDHVVEHDDKIIRDAIEHGDEDMVYASLVR